jgi:hypothetical protein
MDRKYLLVCFSTHKSEILKEIDVTFFATDQNLFDNLRLNYRAIKTQESWFSNVPFLRSVEMPSWLSWCLGDLHLYKPEKINFVSVSYQASTRRQFLYIRTNAWSSVSAEP